VHRGSRTALVIVAATVAVHGLLLVNDGVYWDGHLLYTLLGNRDWTELSAMFSEAGAPYTAGVHWALGRPSHIVLAYKVAMFAAILAAALGIWRLAVESGRATHSEAAWIAVLAMAYPGYRVGVELIEAPNLIAYGCGFWAAWIDLQAVRRQGLGAILIHLIAATLFVFSFVMPSMLMMFVAYVLFAALTRKTGPGDWFAWCLPPAVFVASLLIFRPTGSYTGYNEVSLSINSAVTEVAWFIRYAVYGATNRALAGLVAEPLFAVAALLAARAAFTWSAEGAAAPRLGIRDVAFAVLVFGLVVGPYAVVGKHPLLDGWTTRHTLLVGLPLAIAVVAIGSMSERAWRLKPYVREVALTALAVAFGLSLVQSYLGWQARWVKDASVMSNLKATPGAQRYSIFLMDDRFAVGGDPTYRVYEWPSMFRRIWGDQTHAAIVGERPVEEIERTIGPLKRPRFNFADVDALGCQATLTIQRGRQATDDLTMTITYTYTRLFRPERLAAYFAQVSSVEVSPHPAPGATHCR
jgi:hypothetical protein